MAERASVFQTTQIGIEVTPGVVVACTKRLLCTQVDPVPSVPTNMYRPAGSVFPTTALQQKEWVQANISGVICFNDLVYLLSGLLSTAAITTPTGGTLTRRWTYKPNQFAPDTFQTFTFEKGTASAGAERFAFGLVNSMNFRWTRTEANFSGLIMGQNLVEQVAISGGAADLPALPLDPKSVTIYAGTTQNVNQVQTISSTATGGTFGLGMDNSKSAANALPFGATAANVQTVLDALPNVGKGSTVCTGGPLPGTPIVVTYQGANPIAFPLSGVNNSLLVADNTNATGGTVVPSITTPGGLSKLTRVDSCEVVIPDRYGEGFTLNEADPSFSYVVQKGLEPTVNLVLEHDSVGAGFMTNLRGRTETFLKIVAHGGITEAGFSNWFTIFFPFFFTNNTRGDQNDVYASTYTLGMKYNSTFGGTLGMTVDNLLTAL